MTIRIGKLNGKNLNYLDHDASSLDYALINQGIIEGMQVTNGFVGVGRAIIAVKRTNTTPHQNFMVHAEITTREAVDTSGTKKIWLEVNKQYVNDGTLAKNPNGEGIARIMTGVNYPGNDVFFLPLASVSGGRIADERKFIQKKVLDARNLQRLPRDYFTPNEGGFSEMTEFNNKNYLGLTQSANTYHTVYTTAWRDNSAKPTQIAYSNGEIWMRTGRTETEWNDWQKVFPFTASALDIGGLGAITNLEGNDEIMMRSSGVNKKMTVENLRKGIFGVGSTGSTISAFCTVYTDYNSTSSGGDTEIRQTNGSTWKQATGTAVNASGICSIVGNPRGSNMMDYYIDFSTNNSNWTEWRKNPAIGEVFYAPAGFWRVRIVRKYSERPYEFITVKLIFSK